MISTDLWVWVYAIFTIVTLSILYRDNPVQRLTESIIVGAATAHYVLTGLQALRTSGIERISIGYYSLIIPILGGFLFFARYSKKYVWLSRYPAALMIGIGTGVSVRLVPRAEIYAQIQATIVPLVGADPVKILSNLILVVIVVGAIVNFVFTGYIENRVTRGLREVGRWGVLAAMGSGYGAQVFTFLTTFVGVFQYLILTWLGLGR